MEFTQFVQTAMLPVAAALWVIGRIILKPVKQIPDEFIPVLLMTLGIVAAFEVLKSDFTTACIQGVLSAGLAITANTTIKQITEYIKK